VGKHQKAASAVNKSANGIRVASLNFVAKIVTAVMLAAFATTLMVKYYPELWRYAPRQEIDRPNKESASANAGLPAVLPQMASSIGSMREYVRYAAQYQIQLKLAATQARRASDALDTLRVISTRSEAINRTIQTAETRDDSAARDRETLLDKYLASVEWLGEHDETTVQAAVKLEYDNVNTASVDKGGVEPKEQIRGAIDLLRTHIRLYRQNSSPGQPSLLMCEVDP
jgi:hypothetical protein